MLVILVNDGVAPATCDQPVVEAQYVRDFRLTLGQRPSQRQRVAHAVHYSRSAH